MSGNDGFSVKVVAEKPRLRGFEPISQYFGLNLLEPRRATTGSAAYDIYNNTDHHIILSPGELSEAIPTYFKAYMQSNEVLLIIPRSSHGFKYSLKLANSVGCIDSDYILSPNEGHIFVKFHNQGSKELVIPVGEAMAQTMFINYLTTDNDELTVGGKRVGGFGSTT